MIHKILTDSVVAVHREGNLQLRPDPVDTRDENGLSDSFEICAVEGSEGPNVAEHIRSERGADSLFDSPYELLTSFDVDSGNFVGLHPFDLTVAAKIPVFP
jgi:hypothetical protein